MIAAANEIVPGEEIAYSDVLDTKTYFSIKDRIASVKAYIVGTSSGFTIDSDGYIVNLLILLFIL